MTMKRVNSQNSFKGAFRVLVRKIITKVKKGLRRLRRLRRYLWQKRFRADRISLVLGSEGSVGIPCRSPESLRCSPESPRCTSHLSLWDAPITWVPEMNWSHGPERCTSHQSRQYAVVTWITEMDWSSQSMTGTAPLTLCDALVTWFTEVHWSSESLQWRGHLSKLNALVTGFPELASITWPSVA